MKKYELTTDTKIVLGKKLFRIKALVSFAVVFMAILTNLESKSNARERAKLPRNI